MNVDPVIKAAPESKVVELMTWLSDNTCSWSFEVDPHEVNYESRRSYFDFEKMNDMVEGDYDNRWENGPHLYEIRAHPRTPVVSVFRFGCDLEQTLQLLKQDVIEYNEERSANA